MPKLKTSQWVLERLPELIWIAELIENLGDRMSLDILTTFVKAAHEVWQSGDPGPSFIASCWEEMRKEVQENVQKMLDDQDKLKFVRRALAPLHSLYPEYPLRFLLPKSKPPSDQASLLEAFKARFTSYFDRFERPALKLHSHIFIAEVNAGLMHLPDGAPLPDFDLVYTSGRVDHDDLATSYVAGFVRSSAMSMFAAFKSARGFTAGPAFWRQGLQLEPCTGRGMP
jgi:hypothetical protein